MARFLFYTAPGSGHLYPLVPTMQELRARGHELVVYTEGGQVEQLTAAGFAAHRIDAGIEQREDDTWRARTPIGALRRSVAIYVDRARLEVIDVSRALDAHQPDVTVIDNNCWGAAAALASKGVTWAQAATFLLPLTTPDAPPFGLGLRPARGWPGQVRDMMLRNLALPLFDGMLPPINRLRASLGVPRVSHVPDLYMQAPLVLCYTAAPLEYPRTLLPASVKMVGPGDWDPDTDAPPDWVADLGGPLIVVSASSVYQNDAAIIQTALDALADEPFRVVATTASLDPAQFRVPANAVVERFVSHRFLLSRAAAVICHGGMGITQKALLAGVPVCIVPFGRDQLEVARRVDLAAAGVRLPRRRLTPQDLRLAVHAAIARTAGARDAAVALRAAGGATAAADSLEHLLVLPKPTRQSSAIQGELLRSATSTVMDV